jgi:hypothetical protein
MTRSTLAQQVEDYRTDGVTVLHGLIPTALLGELRREADVARTLARRLHGPQAQRLQPIRAHQEIDARPFDDFQQLDALQALAQAALSPDHRPSGRTASLFEPAEQAWTMAWHRDWVYNVPGIDADRFWSVATDLAMFNQLNAALYDDDSLWFVPGSHARRDTEAERAAFDTFPPPEPAPGEKSGAAHCEAMPGAVQLRLRAGDCAFYRSTAWHTGSYRTGHPRATLHDGFYAAADLAWQDEAAQMSAAHAGSL